MRGTQFTDLAVQVEVGIIPADAGRNTAPEIARMLAKQDHPRGCGEHSLYDVMPVSSWGSSPRMRGTRAPADRMVKCSGIIPADAGNTLAPFFQMACRQDHPRGCGEHLAGA